MICCDGIFFDELTRLPYDRYFVRQAQELIRNQLKRPVMISLDISILIGCMVIKKVTGLSVEWWNVSAIITLTVYWHTEYMLTILSY